MNPVKYTTSSMATLTVLSKADLLFYEEHGILTPQRIDPETGTRYYDHEQVHRAAIVAFLKNFNVPPEDMAAILDKHIPLKEYLLRSKKRVEIINATMNLAHLLQALMICEESALFSPESLNIRTIPAQIAACLEGRAKTADLTLYFSIMSRFIAQQAIVVTGPAFTMYFNDVKGSTLHFKICYPIASCLSFRHPDIVSERLPPLPVASLTHVGSYDLLPVTYEALDARVTEAGLAPSGTYIETYLLAGNRKFVDQSTFITDVAAVLA